MNTKLFIGKNTAKASYGFTLIELLVAAVIIGVLSIVTTQMLFDAVTVNSKQNAVETSSDAGYLAMESISRDIKYARSIEVVNSSLLKITKKNVCVSYHYNSTGASIEKAEDADPPCNPTAYEPITPNELRVVKLEFSPTGQLPESVSVVIEGKVKDSLGEHPIKYETNIKTRVGL